MANTDVDAWEQASRDLLNRDKATQVNNSLYNAATVSPDQAAQNNVISRFTRMPTSAVEAYPDDAKRQYKMGQVNADELIQKSPVLSKFLTVQDHANVMHDDLQNASGIEQTAAQIQPPKSLADRTDNGLLSGLLNFSNWLGTTEHTVGQALTNVVRGSSFAANLTVGAAPVLADKTANLFRDKPETPLSDWWFKNMVAPEEAKMRASELEQGAGFDQKLIYSTTKLAGTLAQIVATGGGAAEAQIGLKAPTAMSILGNATEHAIKSMWFPSTVDAINTGHKVYEATGGDGAAALKAAEAQYVATTGMGLVPLSATGGLGLRMATGAASGVASGEVARIGMNAAMPDNMQTPFSWEDLFLSGVTGSLMGAVMGPRDTPNSFNLHRRTYADAAKADAATAEAAALAKHFDTVAASKVRERDPDGLFRDFVGEATEGKAVFVDAQHFAQSMDKAGITAEELAAKVPEVAKQMKEALETDGYVRIPLADYDTSIAGSPIDAALREHIKTDPKGMTFAEAQQFYQQQDKMLQDAVQKIAEEKASDDAWQAQLDMIYQQRLAELERDARFPSSVNKIYAGTHRGIMSVLADRLSVTPEEAEARYGATVRNAPLGGEVFEQTLPSRWPTSKKLTPSIDDIMLADLDTLRTTPEQHEKAVEAVANEPGMKSRNKKIDSLQEHVINRIKENLLWLHDQIPEEIRQRSKLWYDGAEQIAEKWSAIYGKTKAQTAGILAVLSPQKDWFMNVTMAERVLDILHTKMDHVFDDKMRAAAFKFLLKDVTKDEGDRGNTRAYEAVKDKTLREVVQSGDLKAIGIWLRAYDEAHHSGAHAVIHPEGDFGENTQTDKGDDAQRAWGGFDALGKAASIFLDGSPENISDKIGGEHKVRNFYNNIFNPRDARFATIDTHAVAAGLLRPLAGADRPVADNFGKTGSSAKTGVSGTYPVFFEAYKRAAEERGILPREMQSITWEAVRGMFQDKWKTKENKAAVDAIWQKVDAGKLTVDQARAQILEMAGGIEHPDWWGGQEQEIQLSRGKSYEQAPDTHTGKSIGYEVAPNPDDVALTARWNSLPSGARDQISKDMAWDITRKVFAAFAAVENAGRTTDVLDNVKGELHVVRGGYMGEANTSFSLRMGDYSSAPQTAAVGELLGYALRQREVWITSPDKAKGAEKHDAVHVEGVQSDRAEALYNELYRAESLRDEKGEPLVSGHTTDDGVMVIIVDKGRGEAIAQKVAEYLGDRHNVGHGELFVSKLGQGKGEYDGLRGQDGSQENSAESSLRAHADRLRAEADAEFERRVGEAEQRAAGQFHQPTENDGRVSATGVHFSSAPRSALSGGMYGTGLKGAEGERLAAAKDARIRQRSSYYVNTGKGITPEAGVGGQAHIARLDNLYDADADVLKIFKGAVTGEALNAAESQVLARGFAGYLSRSSFGDQGTAVLLGQHSQPVEHVGGLNDALPRADVVPPAVMPEAKALAAEVIKQRDLPFGQMEPADWQQHIARTNPDLAARLDQAGVWDALPANEPIYKDGIAKVLWQGESNRGGYAPESRTISLLEKANFSTFVHETGHWLVDVYGRIAAMPDAPAEIKADVDTLLKYADVKGATPEERLANWHGMDIEGQRSHHEKLAQAFETYFMEGKAPSLEMQPVMARIRAWMLEVYQGLKALVQLTPEVRGVFDRMLASEEAIKQAESARVFEPFAKPEGVDDAAYQRYVDAGKEATDQGIADMTARSIRDTAWTKNALGREAKRIQKEAAGIRAEIRKEIEQQVNDMPIYRAEEWLRKGTTRDAEGNEVAVSKEALKGARLNAGAVDAMLPKGELARPDTEALRGLTSKEGLHPDLVAEMFGFRNGEDLVRALLDRQPKDEVIDGLTDKRMLEEHGELSSPAAVERAAEAAIHNKARAKFMATGLKLLVKSPISERLLLKGAKEAAEGAVAQKHIGELNARQYQAAEAKANKEVLKLAPKDTAGAIRAQRAALLNNQLVDATLRAQTDVTKGLEYFTKFEKDSVTDNIDVAFREQIFALLGRYDLRKSVTPEKAQEQSMLSLEAFVEKLAGLGFHPDVPERLIVESNRKHYKDMTVEEFRGVVDAVKSLEHMGREVTKIMDGVEARLLAEVAQEAADQTAALPQRKAETNRGLSKIEQKWLGAKALGRSLQASLLKVEQMIDWLDNRNPNGVFNRVVFRKIADAEARRNDLDAKISKQVADYVRQVPDALLKENRGSIEVPGVIDKLTGETQRLTWNEKIMLAGYRGDAEAFAKLIKGEGWGAQAVLDFLDKNMTAEEWAFVRGLSEQFQEVYTHKKAMIRSLGGTAPKDVDRIGFSTPHGEMPGWYWPITYDPARSHQVAERSARSVESVFEDNFFNRADTSTGRELTRNANYAKPMLLSIDTLPRVLKDEIRDATTRKAILEVERFLSNKQVANAITSALSPEHYKVMRSWVVSLANDAHVKPQDLQMWDRVAHEIRTRVTMVGLGFRISTMFMHGLTAAGESVAEAGFKAMGKGVVDKRTWAGVIGQLGPEWMNKGIENFARSDQWVANRDFIVERSAEMRHRMTEMERDVREKLREIDIKLANPALGAVERGKLAVESRAYSGIAMLDMASALPTWMGAYLKAMEKIERGGLGMSEADAVYFADKTVRNAHGGGGVKDMAAVQRGSEFMKLFTMFYTFWNHNVNRLMDTGRRWKNLPGDFANARETGDWAGFRGDVGMLVLRTMMYTLGVQAVHHMFKPPKEDDGAEGWLKWFAKEMASSVFGGVPLARDVTAHYVGGRDYEMSPVSAMVQNTDRLLADLEGKSDGSKFIKHAMTEAGYVFGMPLGQPASSVQFLSDVWSGKQQPEGVTEWWRGLMHGDMKQH